MTTDTAARPTKPVEEAYRRAGVIHAAGLADPGHRAAALARIEQRYTRRLQYLHGRLLDVGVQYLSAPDRAAGHRMAVHLVHHIAAEAAAALVTRDAAVARVAAAAGLIPAARQRTEELHAAGATA